MINFTQRAKGLRRNQTDAEKLLWRHLRNRGLRGTKFRRQYVIGKYIVDFVCIECELILEIDGGQHAEQQGYDETRTRYLEQQGFQVMRFWNNEVLCETEGVLGMIEDFLINNPSPQPSPLGGESEQNGAKIE
jgi:very-short-patch-repair endonuclease